jgi:hypothetical protein
LYHVEDQRAAMAQAKALVERDGGEMLVVDCVGARLVGPEPAAADAAETK